MWPDNETDRDFLNFEGVADTIAETIVQADGRPISIGVSGAWGVGKSSMIKLTRAALTTRQPPDGHSKFAFVEFNAWLYQGYDDARAALLEVIAATLETEANARKTGVEKATEFLGRVRWLRLAKLVSLPAAALALGLPPIGLPGEVAQLVGDIRTDGVSGAELERVGTAASKASDTGRGLIKPEETSSPPKEIQALRDSFEEALAEIGVTLVVLIDDLDRCLPSTTISTLEAIRLFLFLQNTAFVIAADDQMIKYAVRKHFDDLTNDELVANYFDKLIQVPIRVPSLGTQEVRAYVMMLFVESSADIDRQRKDAIRDGLARQLRESWKGKRVDRSFVATLDSELPAALIARLETAERLAPLMTTAKKIAGNPRLVKRFLNALSIRMSISTAQGVGVDEAVLAKLLLFERLAEPATYNALVSAVNADPGGMPNVLEPWEQASAGGEQFDLPAEWESEFVREWLNLPPALANTDLRGALYVGREHAPLITAADRLSSDAAELLAGLLAEPREAESLQEQLTALPRAEATTILDRLIAEARKEQVWGAPPILDACLVVARIDEGRGATLAGFLMERPAGQIEPSIVPKIADEPWSLSVFRKWADDAAVQKPVKTAITRRVSSGNVAKQ